METMSKLLINVILVFYYGIFASNEYKTVWENEKEALSLLENMTLEEKVGQILLARVPSEEEKNILMYHLGGYVLFEKDVKDLTKEQIRNKIDNWNDKSKIPLFLAIDEEGGKVSRIKNNTNLVTSPFLSPQEIFKNGGYAAIYEDTLKKNKLLEDLHININLAPVADVSLNPNSYIYARTFGQDAEATSTYIETVITACQQTNINCTLKHFPGYGENLDTHQGLSYDNRTLDELKEKDLLPFIAGIQSGADLIMVNHNIYPLIDETNPATLSSKIHSLLRDDLNYKGLIVTDDLEMNAIKNKFSTPYVKAFSAGNDVLIVTDIKGAYTELLNAFQTKKLKETDLNRVVFRILLWKKNKNLF